MKMRLRNPAWPRTLLLGALAGMLAVTAADTAFADYRRSCRAVLEIRPNDSSLRGEAYAFSVFNTVSRYSQVNEARRVVRRAITTCLQTHWTERDADTRPYACQNQGALDFSAYPFDNLEDRLSDDLCETNDAAVRMNVDVILFIDGERGCVVDGGNINPATRVDLASGHRINCPVPDGGSWECVGEGCGGPPATPPLPNIRLPGNDIGGAWTPGQEWQTCWQMCEDNDACHAWTFRAAGTTGASSEAGCLLKSTAGEHVPDPCCQSGLKE